MVKHDVNFAPSLALMTVLFTAAMMGCDGGANSAASEATAGQSAEKRGAEIVADFLKRDAAPLRKIRVRFTVRPEEGAEKIYELETWRRQTAEGTDTLTQVVKPADETGATLAIERPGQKTVVVAYSRSQDEFKEMDTNKMFIGGLTAGELLGEFSKYNYGFLGEKQADGRPANEVEGKLKPAAISIAPRIDILFGSDNNFPLELHLFDNTDREIRTYKVTELKDDAHPYAARTEIDNPIYKAKIIVEILSREFPEKADDAVFSREYLRQLARK